jgi:hypothetical protein
LQHGQAYWLSKVRLRDTAPTSTWHTPAGDLPGYGDNAVGRVDVTSLAFEERATTATPVETSGQNATSGATLCDANTGPSTNDVWRVHGIDIAPGPRLDASNAVDLSLRQIDALTLDLGRMRLNLASPLTLGVTGDGVTSITLDNLGAKTSRVQVSLDGVPAGVLRPQHGQVTVSLNLTGPHTVVFTPRA